MYKKIYVYTTTFFFFLGGVCMIEGCCLGPDVSAETGGHLSFALAWELLGFKEQRYDCFCFFGSWVLKLIMCGWLIGKLQVMDVSVLCCLTHLFRLI
jgi:hypothetical protein